MRFKHNIEALDYALKLLKQEYDEAGERGDTKARDELLLHIGLAFVSRENLIGRDDPELEAAVCDLEDKLAMPAVGRAA